MSAHNSIIVEDGDVKNSQILDDEEDEIRMEKLYMHELYENTNP